MVNLLQGRVGELAHITIFFFELMNERGISTVFEQAAYKIREQVIVAAHRSVYPTAEVVMGCKVTINFISHAVQLLKLKFFILK